mgnify:CR=1 FL=1
MEINGDTHDIRVYLLIDIIEASTNFADSGNRLQAIAAFAIGYVRLIQLPGQDSEAFGKRARNELDEWNDYEDDDLSKAYVIGCYNKDTRWLDYILYPPKVHSLIYPQHDSPDKGVL